MLLNREEMFIANICGESYDLPAPQTRNELLLKSILDGDETTLSPVTRIELYLASISGKDVGDLPQPRTRIEMYLAAIAGMEIEPPIPLTSLEQWLASWYESGGSGEEFTTEFLPIVSIMDALAKPARAVVAKMEPIQDLHGHEAPWPAGGGANLIPETGSGWYSPYGQISSTFSNGVWTVTDSHTTDRAGRLNVGTLAAGTYYVAVSAMSVGSSLSIKKTVGDANILNFAVGGSASSFTLTEDTECYIAHPSFTVGTNTITNLWLSKTNSGYSPYSNECPISGRTGVTVERTGVNVWDEQWENGIYLVSNGAKYNTSAVDGRIRTKNPIPIKPETTYYRVSPSDGFRYQLYYDADMNYLSYSAPGTGNASFTTPANAYYMTSYTENASYGDTYNHDISINYPATDKDYHAYTGASYPVSWQSEAGTVYGGTVDPVSGVLTVTHGIRTLDETGSWSLGAYGNFRLAVSGMAHIDADVSGLYCTALKPIAYSNRGSVAVPCVMGADSNNIEIRNMSALGITTVDELKTWLADMVTAWNPVGIVYPLDEPQTYQLTPTQVVQMLKGVNVLWSDADAVQVTYLKKKDS